MPKPPDTWRDLERFVADYLDGERTHWAPEDVRAQGFAVEVKHGKQIPKTVLKWWDQALRNAGTRVPLLVLHPLRWKREDSLVCLTLRQLKEILNETGEEEIDGCHQALRNWGD
jgi:hypothetical protein